MALLGKGLLAIWNSITEKGEAEFVRWHIQEHIPERVGLRGFLRGRRYVAQQGHPKYFNFYETETAQVLESPEYHDRLNAPTPWTRAVIKEFRDTSRTICEVITSQGFGEGAWIESIQINGAKDRESFARAVAAGLVQDIAQRDGIVGVHFAKGIDVQANTSTVESKLRNRPDEKCEWILLIEAVELSFLQALRTVACSDEVLRNLSPGAIVERGIYRLQYGLTHSELGRTGDYNAQKEKV
jgi:hypothetical protein